MKVLFLTVKVGSGHIAMANIVANKFQENHHEIKLHDMFSNDKFSTLVVSKVGFKLLFKFPHTTNFFYKRAKKSDKHLYSTLNKRIKKETLDIINDFQPDVIISTHIAGYIFVKTYQNLFTKPVLNYLISTDFEITPGTANFMDNEYIVIPNEDFIDELANKGFPKDHILPFGIPIKPNFLSPISRKEAIKNLNIDFDENKLTILAMGKKNGIGKSLKIIKKLSNYNNLQLICLAGNNAKLKSKVDNLAKTSKAKIFSSKFNNENVMTIADVMIGKTGGLSSSEALCKNVPILALEYAPMPEYSNLLYLESKNAAYKLDNLNNLYRKITSLNIKSMQESCNKIHKLETTDLIYQHIMNKLKIKP